MQKVSTQMNQDDKSGGTASITHESDPETILGCGDDDMAEIIQPFVKNPSNPDMKQIELSDKVLIVSNKPISNTSKLMDPEFDEPDKNKILDLLLQNESLSHYTSESVGSDINTTNKGIDNWEQQKQRNILASTENHPNPCAVYTKMPSLNSRDMLCELDQIECKIKAAINANQHIQSNSVELETVLREIHSGSAVPRDIHGTLVHLESICEPMSELEISYDRILGKSCLDATVDQRVEELEHENHLLRRKIACLDEELAKAHETKAQSEKNHKEVVEKLKKEARESKNLVRRLQKKKLADMERNFIASINLLEAKMSEEINNGDEFEEKLAAVKAERDTARELNLPLFNDLKRLYSIKTTLEQAVHDLLESEKELMQKEKIADENALRLSNEVLFAHDEISRLTSEMASLAEEKEMRINDLNTRVKILEEENTRKSQDYHDLFAMFNDKVLEKESLDGTIQHLQEENAQVRKKNQELELENLSYEQKCDFYQNEKDDLILKLEALKASTEVQLKERDEQISDLESKQCNGK
ncbi:hypothetical protein HJC23_006274 [Cyclotella cryptica]|uniref:Uncharacterized protein n=1 Tax=Cyclotella cryptica TaxID=29204 RepID=A0ABD3NTF0_9STRA